jgi:hypothetical protein
MFLEYEDEFSESCPVKLENIDVYPDDGNLEPIY